MGGFKRNVSWIFFGNVSHAVLQFLLNILCARSFGSEDYGLINYSASLIAFFTAIGTFGFNGVITKFFACNESDSGRYLGTTILTRIVYSLFAIIILQVIISFDDVCNARLNVIVLCQSLQILFGTGDMFMYWFRYKNQAKQESILRLCAFFVSAIWRLIAIIYLRDLVWYVLGVSVEFGIFAFFLWRFYAKEYKKSALCFSFDTLKEVLKISYPFILSAFLVTIYAQTDKIMLKDMINLEAVGIYSVSLTLAGAISIIPSALIEGFRPDIMLLKVSNEIAYRKRFQQLYGLLFWLSVAYGVFITILAKPIIQILYGSQYLEAVSSLSIIVWYSSFSFFGSANNIFMVAENKTFWVQIFTLIGAILNIVLNIILIPCWGIVGAALASLLTQIVTNYLLMFIIKPLRKCFSIINEGILLRGFLVKNIV